MSADMMIICKEDNSGFSVNDKKAAEGGYKKAMFIDETSVGNPHNKFGEWFDYHYCGSPTVEEQIKGIREHRYTKLTESDYKAIKEALENMSAHEDLDKLKLTKYIKDHIGKHISTENW